MHLLALVSSVAPGFTGGTDRPLILEFRGVPRKSLPQGASDVVTPLVAGLVLSVTRILRAALTKFRVCIKICNYSKKKQQKFFLARQGPWIIRTVLYPRPLTCQKGFFFAVLCVKMGLRV